MSLEKLSTNLYTELIDKKRPADSPLNYPYASSISIDNDEDKGTDDTSAFYIPSAKRQRKECTKFMIFGQYGFFPVNNNSEEYQDEGETGAGARAEEFCVLSSLSFLREVTDRRRSSVFSVLSSLPFANEQEMLEPADITSSLFLKEDADSLCDLSDEEILDSFFATDDDDLTSSISTLSHDDIGYHSEGNITSTMTLTPSSPSEKNETSYPYSSGIITEKDEEDTTVTDAGGGKIMPTDLDVLFGRGQGRNKHPGNERFRKFINEMRPLYFAQGKSRKKKNALSKHVMESVIAYGGRFLEVANDAANKGETEDGTIFVIVDEKRARRKCSQRLREMR